MMHNHWHFSRYSCLQVGQDHHKGNSNINTVFTPNSVFYVSCCWCVQVHSESEGQKTTWSQIHVHDLTDPHFRRHNFLTYNKLSIYEALEWLLVELIINQKSITQKFCRISLYICLIKICVTSCLPRPIIRKSENDFPMIGWNSPSPSFILRTQTNITISIYKMVEI